MKIQRRHSLSILASVASLVAAPAALAQRQPQEGTHYRRLGKPLPGTPGKVEVIEFFWYGCPVCNAFEPMLNAWVAKLPATVQFRHQHVFFGERTRAHQQLFFTLQAMGVESQMRAAIFKAIHEQGNALDSEEAAIKLLQPLGLDVAKFKSTWASFGPKGFGSSRISTANKLAESYGLDGVPSLGIGGRFMTSPVMAGRGEPLNAMQSMQRSLIVADMLIAQALKG